MMRKGVGPLLPDVVGRDLADEIPALTRMVDLETTVLFAKDSADVGPDEWVLLATLVHEALAREELAGVVVVHGTDTMAYAACALAFLLGPVPKPVVFTGAQRPLAEAWTDARENVLHAVHAATLPVREVQIAFGSASFRAVRTTKKDAWALDAFESPHMPPLVRFGVTVEWGPEQPHRELSALDTRLERRVSVLRLFPGLDPKVMEAVVLGGALGLVLEAYGTGNVEQALVPTIERVVSRGVPVLVVSQCPRGRVDLTRYQGGAGAARAGALSGGDMTVEAALTKMMVGLGRFGASESFFSYLADDVVGERRPDLPEN